MPRPHKRKKQLAAVAVQDGAEKRQRASKIQEEKLKAPKEESSPVDEVVAPETITSLHRKKQLTPIATSIAEAPINTVLPDVVTSLPTTIATALKSEDATSAALPDVVTSRPTTIATAIKAEDPTNTALPDVVTSLPPAGVDVIDNGDANTDSVKDTQSNNHPRATDSSTSTITITSTRMGTLQIKLEPVVKTENASPPAPAPAPAPANPCIDQAEASIPMETVSNGPNLNPTVTVYRKATKRTFPWDKVAGELNLTSPSPQAAEIPARKKPRIVEPLPTTRNEAAKKTLLPDVEECLPSHDAPPSSTDTVNASTCRRSRPQIQLRAIETSEAQPDDVDTTADDCALSGPAFPPEASGNAPTRLRSSRRAIPTRNTGALAFHASAATVDTSTHGRSRRQTQRSPIETREAQLDDGDEYDDSDVVDFPSPSCWEVRLSELAEYRKKNGNCNVARNYPYSENSKLANWVNKQRTSYRLNQEGKTSPMTLSRIKELENLGFEWDSRGEAWENSLSKLAEYRKIYGNCNVPYNYSENFKLANWVTTQRFQYRLHAEGKMSSMTLVRIQELESLGFEQWDSRSDAWDDLLSELAAYRKTHGHCNVPRNNSSNTQLANWVNTQRNQYKVYQKGKRSTMTLSRIQELESLGFQWDRNGSVWADRLSELADYHNIHGHCNVPKNYSENSKLARWVLYQRTTYRLHQQGTTTSITPFRIQELESLGFEWDLRPTGGRKPRR
jgi:hypothetical protein